jgi:DNA polymerase ligase (LigD)-like protein
MPRFVILEHDWPSRHWDLFLESGQVLRAWRLLAEPAMGTIVPSEPNAVHRLLYLDYEGPVTGGRGRVLRWDAGIFEWIADLPERLEIELSGQRLRGRAVIEATRTRFE